MIAGAVPVEFDAVAVRVAEIEGFADAMVGGAIEGDVRGDEAAKCVGEGGASGIEDGEVVEAGGARWGWGAAEAFPGVEADVVVVAACGEKGGGVAEALRDLEAEDAVVEGKGAVEVGDAEVDVADACQRVDGRGHMRVDVRCGIGWQVDVRAAEECQAVSTRVNQWASARSLRMRRIR